MASAAPTDAPPFRVLMNCMSVSSFMKKRMDEARAAVKAKTPSPV